MNLLKWIVVGLLVVGLAACSSWRKEWDMKHSNYQNQNESSSIHPMQVPVGSDVGAVQDAYPVPNGPQTAASQQQDLNLLVPPGSMMERYQQQRGKISRS